MKGAKNFSASKAAMKHAEKMAAIKQGATVKSAINKIVDNVKDRNVLSAKGSKGTVSAKGMGAIKQAAKTGRRYITSKFGADTTIEKYRQQTAQRESDNRAKVQQAALAKWNGIINQMPESQSVIQDAINSPAEAGNAIATPGTTNTLGGY